jgi:Golgi phosphoprotein 3 (GPP34)
VARLSGTGLIADDLYLLAHNDVTGRPYLQPRAIGLGLAGALLAELAIYGQVKVGPDRLTAVHGPPPYDELGCAVLALVRSESRPPRDWLLYLARTSARDVALRLEESGYLMRTGSRRPWRGHRWVPVDSDSAFAPIVRVWTVLDPAKAATNANITLAGLSVACGLGPRLLTYGPAGARRRLDLAIQLLPAELREVIVHTQAAVDGLLLAQRV